MPMLSQLAPQQLLKLFNAEINTYFKEPNDSLIQAAHYALEGKGKRLRALIVLMIANAFEVDFETSFTPAFALELIHNYSLIHDDLPCMDDDDYRRGRKTVHKAFDEATAVLSGDLLLNEAYLLLAQDYRLSAEQKVACIETLGYYSGKNELLLGQNLDLKASAETFNFEYLKKVYEKKTSSLFCAALQLGAIVANLPLEQQNQLALVGRPLGLAFQIHNDLKGKLGDVEKNKWTLLGLLSESQAHTLLNRYKDLALTQLRALNFPLENLENLFSEFLAYEI